MPKQTFFNLPDDKRQALLAIAIEEFADHDYSAASISKIVERAGIAKGSIYQYFEDKADMYVYLVEYATATLLAEVRAASTFDHVQDFFIIFRRQMSASARVNATHPKLSRILRSSLQAPAELRAALAVRTGASAQQHLGNLLQLGIESGQLRSDRDPTLMLVMIGALLAELGNYLITRLGIDLDSAMTIDAKAFESPIAEEIYDQVIDILRNGLAAH